MFIIGELINGMYQNIGKAIVSKNKEVIQKCALEQIAAGADALDVNCGTASKDPISDIRWLIESIQEVAMLLYLWIQVSRKLLNRASRL